MRFLVATLLWWATLLLEWDSKSTVAQVSRKKRYSFEMYLFLQISNFFAVTFLPLAWNKLY